MAHLCLFLSATNQLPKFKNEKNEFWGSFKTSFRLKQVNTCLGQFPLINQKRALLGCLEGRAAQAHMLMGEGNADFNAPDMKAYILKLRNLFQPPAESELARIEFESMKQGVQQPITQYHSTKMVTFAQAIPNPGVNNFAYFCTQMVKGIYSNYMKQRVIEAGVVNEAQLLQVMVSTVANVMEA